MANKSSIDYDYVIDISSRDIDCLDKVYPLPCQPREQHDSLSKLKLRRTYKALCSICSCLTSTYNKTRIATCMDCERKIKSPHNSSKIRVLCYVCDTITTSFEKDRYGFVCTDCISPSHKNRVYCPLCEYEIFEMKDEIHPCNNCKVGDIRKPRLLRETKVLCCNCEQVAIQLNPNNQKVYCTECKNNLFITFESNC